MTEQSNFDPTEQGKTHFGSLTMLATPVNLVAGKSYVSPGVRKGKWDEDSQSYVDPGEDTVWAGKEKSANSKTSHVIMKLTKDTQDGGTYDIVIDMLTGDAWYKQIVYPSLKEAFGNKFPVDGAGAFVRIEEVGSGDFYNTGRERVTWKVAENFGSKALMTVASDEFFSQFDSNGGDFPEGWTEEAWEGNKVHIRKSKADKLAAGMPEEAIDTAVAAEYSVDVKFVKTVN